MISLTWKSIHHVTKQAGNNLANSVHPSLQAPGSCSHGECQVRREFTMQIRTRRLRRKDACYMRQRMSCFLVRVCKLYAWELVRTVKFWGTSRIWGPSIRTTTFHKSWDLGWKSSGSQAFAEINWENSSFQWNLLTEFPFRNSYVKGELGDWNYKGSFRKEFLYLEKSASTRWDPFT